MEIIQSPNASDVQNFQFKLQRSLQVFQEGVLPPNSCNLLAAASYYGLVFVGSPSATLLVYNLRDLVNKEIETPSFRPVALPSAPDHVVLSCDQQLLVVTVRKDSSSVALVYNVTNFKLQDLKPIKEIILSPTRNVYPTSLQWNPCQADTLAACMSDGNLAIYQVKPTSLDVQSKPVNARCLCWSPKGKQVVTGNIDGTLSQYKPDLTLVKSVAAPQLYNDAPSQAIAIHWISNYQYAVVYCNPMNPENRPRVTIVNSPKGGGVSCVNYDDICYSMGTQRPMYYYLLSIPSWSIILGASSNSMEVGVLGLSDGTNWQQWTQMDEARAELPLTKKKLDSFPVGLSFDTAAVHQLPWGENEVLPYMPLLHVLSHTGLLVTFNVINVSPNAAALCTPPRDLNIPQSPMISEVPENIIAPITSTPIITKPAPQVKFAALPKNLFEANTIEQNTFSKTFTKTAGSPILVGEIKPFGAPSKPFSTPNVTMTQTLPQTMPQTLAQMLTQTMPQTLPQTLTQTLPQTLTQTLPQTLMQTLTQTLPQTPVHKPIQQVQPKAQGVTNEPKTPSTPTNLSQIPTSPIDTSLDNSVEYKAIMDQATNRKLKAMLIQEVNDFQLELHNFLAEFRTIDVEIESDQEIQQVYAQLQQLSTKDLNLYSEAEDLKGHMAELKMDLIRTCAVVADAKSQPDAYELTKKNQLDPLSAHRHASIKKLVYYIQNQLNQTNKALDSEWDHYNKTNNKDRVRSGNMMLPALDNVYQPLVRQQQTLARQQAVLRTLRRTLESSGIIVEKTPSSMIKASAFEGKGDNLSKLTKNILNMSIDSANPNRTRYDEIIEQRNKLSSDKLGKLRSMLANRIVTKVKPVSVKITEVKKHIKTMKAKHDSKPSPANEKLVRDVVSSPAYIQQVTQVINNAKLAVPAQSVPTSGMPLSTFVANVQKGALEKPKVFPAEVKQSAFGITPQTVAAPMVKPFAPTNVDTKVSKFTPPSSNQQTSDASVKMTQQPLNTFMGMKICSPTPTAGSSNSVLTLNMSSSKPAPSQKTSIFGAPSLPAFGAKPTTLVMTETTKANIPAVPTPTKMSPFSPTPQSNAPISVPPAVIDQQSAETGELENKDADFDLGALSVTPASTTAAGIAPTGAPKVVEVPKSTSIFGGQPKSEPVKTPEPTPTTTAPVTSSEPSISGINVIPRVTQKPATPASVSQTVSPSVFSPVSQAVASSVTTAPVKATALFATANQSLPVSPEVSKSPTSQPTSTSIFGGSAPNILFKPSPTTAISPSTSIFDSSAASGQTSLLGTPPAATGTPSSVFPSTPGSLFGTANASIPTTTATGQTLSSLLGTPPATAVAASSVFPSTPASIFGTANASIPTTTAAPVLSPTTSQPTGSIFGGTPPATGTPQPTASIFGGTPTSSVETPSSVFGSPGSTLFGSAQTTSAPSVFGSPSPAVTSSPSVFGSPVAGNAGTTPQSVFGSPAATTAPQSPSIFGAPTQTAASPAAIFGQAASAASVTNLFGGTSLSTTTAPATTSSSFFGGSPAGENVFKAKQVFGTQSQFGQSGGNVFGSTGGFGQTTTSSNLFGGTSGGSVFGQSSFGTPTTQTTSIFGSASPSATAFGSFSQQTQQKPSGGFGSPQASVFGGGAQTTQGSSVFGAAAPAAPAFGTSSVFGAKPAFGQPTSFGGASPNANTSAFGAFSGGGTQQNVSQAGFGSPSAFYKPQGFGAAPTLGAFGAQPAFGGQPGFGSTSPNKMFGAPAASSAFGSPTQQSSTFENLSTQNTITFGNLAQQNQPPQQAFNTSPSFSNWRG